MAMITNASVPAVLTAAGATITPTGSGQKVGFELTAAQTTAWKPARYTLRIWATYPTSPADPVVLVDAVLTVK